MKASDQSYLNYYFTIPFIYCNSTLHVRHTVLTKEESIHRSALREKETYSRPLAHCLLLVYPILLACRIVSTFAFFVFILPGLGFRVVLLASNLFFLCTRQGGKTYRASVREWDWKRASRRPTHNLNQYRPVPRYKVYAQYKLQQQPTIQSTKRQQVG